MKSSLITTTEQVQGVGNVGMCAGDLDGLHTALAQLSAEEDALSSLLRDVVAPDIYTHTHKHTHTHTHTCIYIYI